jgi:mRNA-degrading endonuclease RelE of RelBE toxin-antitoxin system
MKLPSNIQFIDEKTREEFEKLKSSNNSENKETYGWLVRAFEDIGKNCFCGIQIPKKLIPEEYLEKGVHNLWKYNLPNAWRLIYSIEHGKVLVIAIILEWMDHKTYERRFNY